MGGCSESKTKAGIDSWGIRGCPNHATQPRNNAAFWRKKLAANRARDLLVTRTLRGRGWQVVRIWEHELKRKNERRLLARLRVLGIGFKVYSLRCKVRNCTHHGGGRGAG